MRVVSRGIHCADTCRVNAGRDSRTVPRMARRALMSRTSEIAMTTISARSSRRSWSSPPVRCCEAPECSGGENPFVLKIVHSRQNDARAVTASAANVGSKDMRWLGLPEARPGQATHPAPGLPYGVTQPVCGSVQAHNRHARTLCVHCGGRAALGWKPEWMDGIG